MHAAEWIALLTQGVTLGGVGFAGVLKIVAALERMGESLRSAVEKLNDHEARIRDLEH